MTTDISHTDKRLEELERRIDALNNHTINAWSDNRSRIRGMMQSSLIVSLVSFGLALIAVGVSALSTEEYSHYGGPSITIGMGVASFAVGAMIVAYVFRDFWW